MVQIENLHFSYPRKRIYKDVSCSIPQGSITGLLGRNGEGKTTFLKIISGYLFAQQGSVSVNGRSPSKRSADFLQQVFMLPEEFQCPNVNILDYCDAIGAFYPNYSHTMVLDLLREFDLSEQMNLRHISHGQRKKAMIVLALALRVPILLMDEPTNGLDIPSKSVFRRLLARSIEPHQLVIISTHQVRDLEQSIDRILLVDGGEFICNTSISDLSALFSFRVVNKENESSAIYAEQALMGNVGVFAREEIETVKDNMDEGEFSMELFFNAMVANRAKMQECLSRINQD